MGKIYLVSDFFFHQKTKTSHSVEVVSDDQRTGFSIPEFLLYPSGSFMANSKIQGGWEEYISSLHLYLSFQVSCLMGAKAGNKNLCRDETDSKVPVRGLFPFKKK